MGFEGPRAEVLGCVRSMLAAVALLHGPDHVLIAVAAEDPRAPDWDWVKWLPHAAHPTVRDRVGAARMIYDLSLIHI